MTLDVIKRNSPVGGERSTKMDLLRCFETSCARKATNKQCKHFVMKITENTCKTCANSGKGQTFVYNAWYFSHKLFCSGSSR